MSEAGLEHRVLLEAGVPDTGMLCRILDDSGIANTVVNGVDVLCREIERGAAAAVIRAEHLTTASRGRLVETLGKQPEWSDFPLLVLTGVDGAGACDARLLEELGAIGRGILLLQQPLHSFTLLSSLRTMIALRTRQYQVRDERERRRRTEARLRRSEERFRLVAAATNDAIWDADLETGTVWWNKVYGERYNRGQGTDKSWQWWIDRIHPEDRARVLRGVDHARHGPASSWSTEYRFRLPDGRWSHVYDRAYIDRDADGKALRFLGAMQDQSAQKHALHALQARERQQAAVAELGQHALSSHRLQPLLDSAASIVAETLQVEYCKILELCPGGADLLLRAGFGWRPGLIGRTTVSARDGSQAGFTLANGRPVIVKDLHSESRFDGQALLRDHGVTSGISCVVAGPQGRPWGVLGAHTREHRDFSREDLNFLTSIANVLTAAIERRHGEELLREADRRKDAFLATLSHELRNPLAPIRNALHILKTQGPAGPGADSVYAMIERQLQHMVRLIDDLLDVTRITHGRIRLHRERIDLTALLAEVAETARAAVIGAAGQELDVMLPAEAVWIDADAVRLTQVFYNLLENASKFSARKACIRLSAETAGRQATVRVADPGIGIAAENLPRLFRMFSQPVTGVPRTQAGLGIGLWLVWNLVQRHGGSVQATSTGTGCGSEFSVRLPLATGAPATHLPAPAKQRGRRAAPARRRILLAEDDPAIAESLTLLLQLDGHEVETVHDGTAAIEKAAQYHPEVILLDIGLPALDGYAVCRQLRAKPGGAELLIMALSGWGGEQDLARSRQAGFDTHLVKPVDPARLLEKLQAAATQEQVTTAGT